MGHKKQTDYKTDASDHEPDHITDFVFGNIFDTVFHDSPLYIIQYRNIYFFNTGGITPSGAVTHLLY